MSAASGLAVGAVVVRPAATAMSAATSMTAAATPVRPGATAMSAASGGTSGEEKAVELRGYGAEARNVFVNAEQANTDSVARLLDGSPRTGS